MRGRAPWVGPVAAVLGVGLAAGLVYAFWLIPFEGHDEPDHMVYALGVSHGHLLAERRGDRQGMVLPSDEVVRLRVLYAERYIDVHGLRRTRRQIDRYGLPGDPTELDRPALRAARDRSSYVRVLGGARPRRAHEFVAFTDTVAYPPLAYVLPGGAVAVGRAAGLSLADLLRVARVVGLVSMLAVAALAIVRFPASRWTLAVCVLLPVSVFQAAMLSADGLTNAFALLVLATSLRLACAPRDRISRAMVIETVVAVIGLALCKPPYAVFALVALVPLLVRRDRAGLAVGAAVAGGVGFQAWWSWLATGVNPYHHPVLGTVFPRFAAADPPAQVDFVVHHPARLPAVIVRTLVDSGPHIMNNTLFEVRWYLPIGAAVLFVVALLASAFGPRGHGELVRFPRMIVIALVGVAVLTTTVVLLAAYVGWNRPGDDRIYGAQGRYLLPVLAVIAVCIPARTSTRAITRQRFAIALTGAVVVASAWVLAVVPSHLTVTASRTGPAKPGKVAATRDAIGARSR